MARVIVATNILGHKCSVTGYSGSPPYFQVEKGAVDGLGRQHIRLFGICDVCDKKFFVGYIHADEEGNLFNDKKK